jgi:hypothetical protein
MNLYHPRPKFALTVKRPVRSDEEGTKVSNVNWGGTR